MMDNDKFVRKLLEEKKVVIKGLFTARLIPARKGKVYFRGEEEVKNKWRVRITPSNHLKEIINEFLQ